MARFTLIALIGALATASMTTAAPLVAAPRVTPLTVRSVEPSGEWSYEQMAKRELSDALEDEMPMQARGSPISAVFARDEQEAAEEDRRSFSNLKIAGIQARDLGATFDASVVQNHKTIAMPKATGTACKGTMVKGRCCSTRIVIDGECYASDDKGSKKPLSGDKALIQTGSDIKITEDGKTTHVKATSTQAKPKRKVYTWAQLKEQKKKVKAALRKAKTGVKKAKPEDKKAAEARLEKAKKEAKALMQHEAEFREEETGKKLKGKSHIKATIKSNGAVRDMIASTGFIPTALVATIGAVAISTL